MSKKPHMSIKKVSQDDLRKLMADHKGKLQTVTKKIDSPLAKYNDAGQLTCILCKSIVRSENIWNVHINTKQHKENIEYAKKLKEQTHNFTAPSKHSNKRPASPIKEQTKKLKGILKNSHVNTKIPTDFFDLGKTNNNENSSILESETPKTEDSSKKDGSALNTTEEDQPSDKEKNIQEVEDVVLPEGFFDDPVLDAKVRNVQYKDPIEEEWEKFQKEMKEETSVSAAIIAGEHEEATAERQIDEIDEQMRNWSRVLDLDKKKEDAKKQKELENTEAMECNSVSSEDEDNFDEYLDWRAKKSYR